MIGKEISLGGGNKIIIFPQGVKAARGGGEGFIFLRGWRFCSIHPKGVLGIPKRPFPKDYGKKPFRNLVKVSTSLLIL